MKKIILIFIVFISLNVQISLAEEISNIMENTIEQEDFINNQEIEDQRINEDEGYGNEDEEYYGSEGNNAQD